MSSKDVSFDQVDEHVKGLKIHAMISSEFDADHQAALSIPLGYNTLESIFRMYRPS